jgi:3-dehydroquinate synthase
MATIELTNQVPSTQAASYPIVIGRQIVPTLLARLREQFPKRRPFVISDANLQKSGWLDKLIGKESVGRFVIDPAGENSKTWATVGAIVEAMEHLSLGRDTLVIGLGGGTVGDMAGFAASIFKRGVPVVHVPTTTVAQADSAIGGKTGVDSSQSKNAFGTFHHPAGVYIDVATLETLDDRQFRAGLVESVKHALIADASYFGFLETHLDAILARDLDLLEQLAGFNCRIKGAVVEQDPTETNQRRLLNYGHTIGHAVESAADYTLLHGEAVAIGIAAALQIEKQMRLADADRIERVCALLGRLSVPLAIPANLPTDTLMDLLTRDKKAVGGWPRFVLLEKIGKPLVRSGQYAHEVSPEIVRSILNPLG